MSTAPTASNRFLFLGCSLIRNARSDVSAHQYIRAKQKGRSARCSRWSHEGMTSQQLPKCLVFGVVRKAPSWSFECLDL
ncbi:hypothetical protein M433DRAFT_535534 [Acidomyces richmondensis BFW]|nr:hypothetical protein M433DRAFT_535534 [Acidomyces richmondensis BFW]